MKAIFTCRNNIPFALASVLILWLVLCSAWQVQAQQAAANANCTVQNGAFGSGEVIEYDVAYNWGILWVKAATATFKTQRTTLNGQAAYYFNSTGSTFSRWDWLFKVRDTFSSWVDYETLRPLKFWRNTHESGYHVDNKYRFDWARGQIFTDVYNSKAARKKDTLAVNGCPYDVLTAIYYARNIDFTNVVANQKIPLKLIIDNKSYDLYIRYVGKEMLKNRDGKRYNCIVFKPLLVEGTIFDGGEDMTVWVTDDANRIPIMVEAKITVGSIKAYLKSTQGLRHPETALIAR